MDLTALRAYTRILADELDEAPEGLFSETELDVLLNVAKDNVYLELVDLIPHRFRKSVTIDLVAAQEEYVFAADLSEDIDIAVPMAVEVILLNVSGKRPWPLIEITPELDHDVMESPTDTDDYPRYWRWAQSDTIAFRRIPASSLAAGVKMLYFPEIDDLDEAADEPDLPNLAHPLICIDALRQWQIRSAEVQAEIENRYQGLLDKVVKKYSLKSLVRASGQLPHIIEMSGYEEDIIVES